MSGFEYIFPFDGLLLGLAVANAVGNRAEMWRSSGAVKVGLTPPLLCVFILLAAAQQWVSFWEARDALTMTAPNLLICIGMAVPYTFVSHGMTPAREGSASFESFYIDHRKTLMGVLIIPPVLSMIYNFAMQGVGEVGELVFYAGAIVAPRVLIPACLAFTRSPRVHALGLAILAAHTVWRMFL